MKTPITALLLSGILALALGCGGSKTASTNPGPTGNPPPSGPPPNSTQLTGVYAASLLCSAGNSACADGQSSDGIEAFTVDEPSGTLQTVAGSPFSTGSFAQSTAVTPSGRFLYVADRSQTAGLSTKIGTDDIVGFSIDSQTGALTRLNWRVAAKGPAAIAVHPSGNFLYLVGDSDTEVFSIDSNSAQLLPRSSVASGGTSLAITPDGKYLYVAGFNSVLAFQIDSSTGGLSSVPGSPYDSGSNNTFTPTAVAVHPSGQYLYVPGQGFDQSFLVAEYRIDPGTGALTPLASAPLSTGAMAVASLAFTPQGSVAFGSVSNEGQIQAFSVNLATGDLQLIPGATQQTGPAPQSLALNSEGSFLFVESAGLFGYRVGTAASLAPLPGSPQGTAQEGNAHALAVTRLH